MSIRGAGGQTPISQPPLPTSQNRRDMTMLSDFPWATCVTMPLVCHPQVIAVPDLCGDLTVCTLAFANTFHISQFGRYSITCPDPIARSSPKRQRDYFYGRLAARLALESMGCMPSYEVGSDSDGRPQWPPGLVGSISHSGDLAAAVVSRRQQYTCIGLDVQYVPNDCNHIDTYVATESERAAVRRQIGQVSESTITALLFSAKETAFKAFSGYLRCVPRFHDMRVVAIDKSSQRMIFSIDQAIALPTIPRKQFGMHYRLLGQAMVLTLFAFRFEN